MADENKKVGKELLSDLKEALSIQGDFRDILKDSVKELQKSLSTYDKIAARLENLNKTSINTKTINADILKNKLSQYTNTRKLADLETKLTEDQKNGAKDFNDTIKKIQRFEAARIKASNEGNKQLEIRYISQIKSLNDKLDIDKQSLGLDQLSYAQALKSEELYGETNNRLAEELKIEKEVNKQLGVSGGLAQKFAQKLGLGEEVYAAMVLEARKVVDENGKATNPGKWKVFKAGIKEAGAQLKESLNDPLVQAGLIMKANSAIFSGIGKAFSFIKDIAQKVFGLITGWNDRIFEFGKNLGVGEQDARSMMNHFQSMALNSGPLFLNMTGISKAFSDMSESLGFIAPMNDEMLQTATLLQRQFGLTATDLEAINANSALSGKSFKDTFDTINAIRIIEGGRNKVMMSQKQMMGEISKVSATVLMNFKGNVPALAEAVVRAKKLGLSLNEIQGTTDQFLDFEGSISKEFEAQLFTGEDLNLQQLRRLALAHDTKGMMEEIGKRIPTMDKWNNTNTLAQEAYANAMGLTADKVSEIIQKQQIANKLGVDASLSASQMYQALKDRNLTEDQIVQKMKEAGAQQYLTAAMSEKIGTFIDNIKMTLGQMLEGELGQTITGFINMASNSQVLHGWLKKIEGVLKGVGTFFSNLPENLRLMLSGFAKIAGIIAALEGAIGLLLLVKSYGLDPRGWALMAGAAKLGVAAYAANEGSNALGEMISVSKAAANNQIGSTNSGAASTTGTTNQGNQPINTYIQNQFTVDGQPLHVQTIKNAQSSGPVDNSGGAWFHVHNYSISGGK